MSAAVDTGSLSLLRADPHSWGKGFVHLIDEERDKTLCGQTPVRCPGTRFLGSFEDITCKQCLRSIEAHARWEEREREREQIESERAANAEVWWQQYDAYLLGPVWQRKRTMVLRRAAGHCEGCGDARATQVHHRRYPQDCTPGSQEWIAQEKLFDLIAICRGCHDDVHGKREP